MTQDAWVEVRLGALKHNLREVKRFLPASTSLMAVVKANAYGHGIVRASEAFVASGADALAVSRLSEAAELREAGIGAPIVLLTPVLPADVEVAIGLKIECAVCTSDALKEFSSTAERLGVVGKVHLKVDTGMGRLGADANTLRVLAGQANDDPCIQLAGYFSHLAQATEKNLGPSRTQLARFESATKDLPKAVRHLANSAAAFRLPESRFDAVRIGTLLYGQRPCDGFPKDLDLRPTWSLKARVIALRDLPAGVPIGYGAETKTRRPTRAAVLAIGTSDGFTMSPDGPIYRQSAIAFLVRKRKRRLSVQFGGASAPVLGRVSMNLTSVDVTDLPPVQVGDVADIPCLRLAASGLLPRDYVD